MYVFSDLTTIVLAIYVGCHLYMTVSAYVSKTYDSVTRKIDSITKDFHTIARSIENASECFAELNRTNASTSRTSQRTNNQLLALIYGMVVMGLMNVFNINLQSVLSSLFPILTQLATAYMRGSQNGTNDQYGMNEEMRTMLMQTLMQNITRPNVTRPPTAPSTRFTTNFRNSNYDEESDTESDITEIVIENTETHVPTNTPAPNSPVPENESRESGQNSLGSGNLSELSNLVVVNGNTEITY